MNSMSDNITVDPEPGVTVAIVRQDVRLQVIWDDENGYEDEFGWFVRATPIGVTRCDEDYGLPGNYSEDAATLAEVLDMVTGDELAREAVLDRQRAAIEHLRVYAQSPARRADVLAEELRFAP